ncbi:unnamed protein product [Mytilus coruscus]|uniref:Uncharacterized protein n=1 Tax=Mytilus coruscus TaxID=42192 RepID=A0A6J8DFL7_MYTCO|nr:unnamed protein product [Mytilus coruscus]
MSRTDSQRPELHDVTTAVLSRAIDSDPRIVTQDEMVPSIQENHGGALAVFNKKPDSLSNIETWTSAFMIYMAILLEKWPSKAQEYLKYMQSIRLTSSRGTNNDWAVYDEHYRLKKERYLTSSWGVIDQELWVLCVVTGNINQSSSVVTSNNFPPSLNYQSRQVLNINPSRI